jgi:hypothetical protein
VSTDEPKQGHLPGGTGTGPAGGAAGTPTPPARDPAAEAAALAMFEEDEKKRVEKDLPVERAKPAEHKPAAAVVADAKKPVAVTGGDRVVERKPAAKVPVVMFDKVTKTYGTGVDSFTAIKDVSFSIEDYPGRGEFV